MYSKSRKINRKHNKKQNFLNCIQKIRRITFSLGVKNEFDVSLILFVLDNTRI